jgi:hypothetical protein
MIEENCPNTDEIERIIKDLVQKNHVNPEGVVHRRRLLNSLSDMGFRGENGQLCVSSMLLYGHLVPATHNEFCVFSVR